jgi:hypothetical protein
MSMGSPFRPEYISERLRPEQRDDEKFRVESTPEDELEARVIALAFEGWDPVSVWRADGKTGMLLVILKRWEKPMPRKGEWATCRPSDSTYTIAAGRWP